MTVLQMRNWLEDFPDDAIIEVINPPQINMIDYGNVEGMWEFIDYTNFKWIDPGHKYYKKIILRLGRKE